MAAPWKLTRKLGVAGAAVLAIALASIGLTLAVTWQLEGGAAAVNEAGRMRMQTWQLAHALAAGDRAETHALADGLDALVDGLERGDPARPLALPRDAETRQALDEVRVQWRSLRAGWLAAAPPPPDAVAAQARSLVGRIDALVGAIEHRLALWTAVLHGFQLALLLLVIAAAVASLYGAHLLLFGPLARLQHGLGRVERGEFDARIEAGTQDEFGALADGFNRMAATLAGLYGQLEQKVRDKTQRLEAEHGRLAALYEASAAAAGAETLEALAQGFVRQLRRVAGADAAAVRWSDEGNRRYLLLAADSLPREMVDAEACIDTGGCLCGQPRADAATRVIPIQPDADTQAAPPVFAYCARAGFQSLLTVPLRVHDRLRGEVDLFYRGRARLGDEDRALLDALAQHLAGAMESLRAKALEREAAVAEERALLARELHDSIAQSLAFLKIQVQLLRDAVRRGDAARTSAVLGELEAGVRESTADVRELLLHFRTRTQDEDIVPALQSTLRKFEHQTGLDAHLEVHGHGLPLDPDVQVQVLHVVQEALSNVRKHARAHAVWVDVQQAPRWRVEVRDDGAGFAPADAASDTHVGLDIMRERAGRIGATVEVDSGPGQGTRVVLTLPERQPA